MITEKDLQEAIAECEGARNPNASTCIKLASFYTIKNQLYGDKPIAEHGYSFSAPPVEQVENIIGYSGGTEFSQAISGKTAFVIWEIIDELMDVLKAINPRLYDGVMRKIEQR